MIFRIMLFLAAIGFTQVVHAATGWAPVRNAMRDERWAPSAVLMASGTSALVAGGFSYAVDCCVATIDRFDLAANQFIPSRARLTYPRDFAPATCLPDGRVLIAGGYNTILGTLNTGELYDPATDRVQLLDSRMIVGRELFTATLLQDGRVLAAGGLSLTQRGTQASADLFDPADNTFHAVKSQMSSGRFGQAAARLADGRVLIVGGSRWKIGKTGVTLATADIFDPITNTFHVARGVMAVPRDRPTATLLSDGRVLIAGGQNTEGSPVLTEVFDPKTETFTTLPGKLAYPRMAHSDCLLPDGRVLLAGGWCATQKATTNSSEFFDPALGTFTGGPLLPDGVHDMALLCFPDGSVLFAGGKKVINNKATSLDIGAVWKP